MAALRPRLHRAGHQDLRRHPLQQLVDDDFRGRVFTLYDTLFNVTFVAAAVLTAVLIPDSGHSPAAVVAISVVYAVVAIGYLRFTAAVS